MDQRRGNIYIIDSYYDRRKHIVCNLRENSIGIYSTKSTANRERDEKLQTILLNALNHPMERKI